MQSAWHTSREEPAPDTAGEAVPAPPAPHDVLVEAEATRSPAEVAALARSLGTNGHGEVAARLMRAAARDRTVGEVTDLGARPAACRAGRG